MGESGSLPPGWDEAKDDNGISYYYNLDTGANQYEHPGFAPAAAPPAATPPTAPVPAAASAAAARPEPLRCGTMTPEATAEAVAGIISARCSRVSRRHSCAQKMEPDTRVGDDEDHDLREDREASRTAVKDRPGKMEPRPGALRAAQVFAQRASGAAPAMASVSETGSPPKAWGNVRAQWQNREAKAIDAFMSNKSNPIPLAQRKGAAAKMAGIFDKIAQENDVNAKKPCSFAEMAGKSSAALELEALAPADLSQAGDGVTPPTTPPAAKFGKQPSRVGFAAGAASSSGDGDGDGDGAGALFGKGRLKAGFQRQKTLSDLDKAKHGGEGDSTLHKGDKRATAIDALSHITGKDMSTEVKSSAPMAGSLPPPPPSVMSAVSAAAGDAIRGASTLWGLGKKKILEVEHNHHKHHSKADKAKKAMKALGADVDAKPAKGGGPMAARMPAPPGFFSKPKRPRTHKDNMLKLKSFRMHAESCGQRWHTHDGP